MKVPVFLFAQISTFVKNSAVEPLPLVPAIWIILSFSSGQ